MNRTSLFPAMLALLIAAPALGQSADGATPALSGGGEAAAEDSSTTSALDFLAAPAITIQHLRPSDQRGLNVFEAPKEDGVPYAGFRLDWGAAFTQQFQALSHENAADAKEAVDAAGKTYDANQLVDIGPGFNLATANLNLNAQLAPGIRVAMSAYLSSRHHQEAWVKDGYLQIDESPIDHPILNSIMDVVTIKAGMFQLNYGDAHFRRSDNGQALYNPFVGNLILDAWNFETGAEIYARRNGFLGMVGITGGQNKGDVTNPDARGPAYLAKLGYDQQLTDDLRVRLTGSMYSVDRTPSANLFNGDRAGSRYYMVLENTVATPTAQFTSGHINPGFANEVRAFQVNPFVKLGGLEVFGVLEQAEGKASAEEAARRWNQYAADVVYRFFQGEKLFVGARYNTVKGTLRGMTSEIGIDRTAIGAGWFITPTVVLKGEYVNQRYNDFPTDDIRHGGRFNGFVMEGAVAF